MSYVRETGTAVDMDELPLHIGVDYDTITLGTAHGSWQFTLDQVAPLMTEIAQAAIEAAHQHAQMAQEAQEETR